MQSCCVLVLATMATPSALGGDSTWIGGTGDWATSSNWSAGVPGSSDTATIGNGGTAQVSAPFNYANIVNITNGSTVAVQSGQLVAPYIYVGSNQGTQLSSGTLLYSSTNYIGGSTIELNGTLRATASNTVPAFIQFEAGTDSVISAATGTTLTLNHVDFLTSASDGHVAKFGSASDTGTIIINPSQAVWLSASPGPVEIAGGTVEDTTSNTSYFFASALGKVSSVTIDTGATLQINSDGNGRISSQDTFIKLFGSGQLVMGGLVPRLVLGDSNFSGQISGTGYVETGGDTPDQPTATVILTGNNNSAIEFQIGTGSTLQIGNGGATGSLSNTTTVVGYSYGAADGSNSAVLEFDRADNITYGGRLEGSPVLKQAGSGILTITANNSLTGGAASFYGTVAVTSGGLSISSDNNLNGNPIALSNATTLYTTATAVFNSPVTVTGDPTFNIASGTTTTWAGQISDGAAAGEVEVTGGGGLILTNTSNSYSGGTVVKGYSDLVITNDAQLGATSGGLTLGDATTAGTLQLNAAFNLSASRPITLAAGGGIIDTNGDNGYPYATISQAIAGSGGLTKAGSGTLTLTATNTYSGGTTITGGALQIGNGGTTGSIVGNITGSGFVIFDRSDVYIYSGVISGGGGMTQTGTGTLILTGNSTYSGNTTISGGINSPGTLQIGAGGTSGSVASKIVDNGYLLFDRSDAYAYANVISGFGSVAQIGTGTLILSGINTYTGGTTVSNGTLSISADSNLGDTAGGISLNGGTLQFGASVNIASTRAITLGTSGGTIDTNGLNATVSQGITGAGGLVKVGAGTLTLSGNNTYAGSTTISSGALQIGASSTSGAITGNITDSASLLFDRSDAVSYAGVISGTGNVSQVGSGTLTLTGNNTYTGTTTVSSGTLQIGAGSTSGAIAGNIADNAALIFNRSDAYTYAGAISGSGSVTQAGSGTLTLSGTSSYTGTTTVSAGQLVVNGRIASAVTINSGATLGGTGTVGTTTVTSGGTLAPGNGIGTLTVNGNLTLASGSTYVFQTASASSDLVTVTGTANISGTLTAQSSGSYDFNQKITVLTAAGGLNGTFSSYSGFGPSVIATLGYDADSAYFTLRPATISQLLPAGLPLNITNVAGAIDQAILHDNGYGAFESLANLSSSDLQHALSQLSGEVGAHAAEGGFQSNADFIAALGSQFMFGSGGGQIASDSTPASVHPAELKPFDTLAPGSLRLWATTYGGWSNTEGNKLGAHGTNRSEAGLVLALDYRVDADSVIGAAIGYGQNWWNVKSDLGTGAANTVQLGLYGTRSFGAYYVSGLAAYSVSDTTTNRTLNLSGANLYRGSFQSGNEALNLEAGRRFAIGEGTALTPYAAFQVQEFNLPSYSEKTIGGSSSYALQYASKSQSDMAHDLGLQLDNQWQPKADMPIALSARLGWVHQYAGVLSQQASFVSFSNTAFTVYGSRGPKDAGRISLEMTAPIGDDLTVTSGLQTLISSTAQSYGGNIAVALRW